MNQQLINYIKKALNNGVSEDRIRLNLFKKKWPESEVEDSLRIAKRELKEDKEKEEIVLLKREVEQIKEKVTEGGQGKEKKGRKKNPVIALFLSFVICGAGQIYNGEVLKGILFGVGYLLCLGLYLFYGYYMVLSSWANVNFAYDTLVKVSGSQRVILLSIAGAAIVFVIGSMIDAYKRAKTINKKCEEVQPTAEFSARKAKEEREVEDKGQSLRINYRVFFAILLIGGLVCVGIYYSYEKIQGLILENKQLSAAKTQAETQTQREVEARQIERQQTEKQHEISTVLTIGNTLQAVYNNMRSEYEIMTTAWIWSKNNVDLFEQVGFASYLASHDSGQIPTTVPAKYGDIYHNKTGSYPWIDAKNKLLKSCIF